MVTPKTRVRGRSRFRQTDMERAVRGAKASGFEIGGIEVTADGTIRVLSKAATEQASGSELENWMTKRDARPA